MQEVSESFPRQEFLLNDDSIAQLGEERVEKAGENVKICEACIFSPVRPHRSEGQVLTREYLTSGKGLGVHLISQFLILSSNLF